MGKIREHISNMIIPEVPDRHANRLSIYKSIGGQYRINFRNLQIRLSAKDFETWKKGFSKARVKLAERMEYDVIQPITPEQAGRRRVKK